MRIVDGVGTFHGERYAGGEVPQSSRRNAFAGRGDESNLRLLLGGKEPLGMMSP